MLTNGVLSSNLDGCKVDHEKNDIELSDGLKRLEVVLNRSVFQVSDKHETSDPKSEMRVKILLCQGLLGVVTCDLGLNTPRFDFLDLGFLGSFRGMHSYSFRSNKTTVYSTFHSIRATINHGRSNQ